MKSKLVLFLAGLLAAPGAAVWGQTDTPPATTPAPTTATTVDAPGNLAIDFSALVDGYYSFNNNHPASGFNTLRNFEVKANQFSLNMAKFTLGHTPDPVGFQLDLGFGRAFQIMHSTEPAGTDLIQHIPQAFISIKPSTWGGFQFDFGKFYTSAGAELTENNLTWSYGRGYLYTNGPYYHFGARMTKPLTKQFTVGLQVVNGWNNVEDNNSGKTLGFTTAWTGTKVSWFNTYYVGPEKNSTNDGIRHFYDTVLNLNPNSKTSFYVNFDYGRENQAVNNDAAEWVAIGVSGRFQTSEHTALALRYENYNDKDGFITLQQQTLQSFTATGEYKWPKGMIARLEYRRDWSDKPYFERGYQGLSKNQNTLTIGFIAYFNGSVK